MNAKEFAKGIKKYNTTDRGISRLMFAVFLSSVFFVNNYTMETDGFSDVFLFGVSAVIVCIFSVYFYNTYIRIYSEDSELGINVEYLHNVVNVNAFSTKKYFACLRKNMLLWQIIMFGGMLIAGIIHKSITYAAGSVIVFTIPFIVGIVMEKRFAYMMTHRINFLHACIAGLSSAVLSIAAIIVAVIYLIIPVIMLWALISDGAAQGLNDNEIIYRSYNYSFMTAVVFLAIMIFLFALFFPLGKKTVLKRIILGIVTVLLCVTELVLERYSYTDTRPDGFTVVTFAGRNEYSFDDVEKYEICSGDGDIQVEVTFDDGNTCKLFSGTSTATDAYEETYYSEYNYTADLVKTLNEHGASGKLKDVDRLREEVDGLDEELSEGLEEIISLMSD